VLAAPIALERAGLSLREIDLIEMHEAFAAQVLCNLRGFESREWRRAPASRSLSVKWTGRG